MVARHRQARHGLAGMRQIHRRAVTSTAIAPMIERLAGGRRPRKRPHVRTMLVCESSSSAPFQRLSASTSPPAMSMIRPMVRLVLDLRPREDVRADAPHIAAVKFNTRAGMRDGPIRRQTGRPAALGRERLQG
jgi:hypothetical protein